MRLLGPGRERKGWRYGSSRKKKGCKCRHATHGGVLPARPADQVCANRAGIAMSQGQESTPAASEFENAPVCGSDARFPGMSDNRFTGAFSTHDARPARAKGIARPGHRRVTGAPLCTFDQKTPGPPPSPATDHRLGSYLGAYAFFNAATPMITRASPMPICTRPATSTAQPSSPSRSSRTHTDWRPLDTQV